MGRAFPAHVANSDREGGCAGRPGRRGDAARHRRGATVHARRGAGRPCERAPPAAFTASGPGRRPSTPVESMDQDAALGVLYDFVDLGPGVDTHGLPAHQRTHKRSGLLHLRVRSKSRRPSEPSKGGSGTSSATRAPGPRRAMGASSSRTPSLRRASAWRGPGSASSRAAVSPTPRPSPRGSPCWDPNGGWPCLAAGQSCHQAVAQRGAGSIYGPVRLEDPYNHALLRL